MSSPTSAPSSLAIDTSVDLLVVGAGTGMAGALSAHEQGLSVLIAEKTEYVGGSTALSGGGIWIPANPVLLESGSADTLEMAREYVGCVVGDTSPRERWRSALDNGPDAVAMVRRTTPLKFLWARGYSDYHAENPGGQAVGRTIESRPFDLSVLGEQRPRLRPTALAGPVPMPITSVDYRWMNLLAKKPGKGIPAVVQRVVQGLGGKAIGREYVAGGQALAAGLYAGVLRAGIPVWTETALVRLLVEDGRVIGAVLRQDGREVTVTARRGVVISAGGFDHNLAMRHEYQSERLEDWSQGNPANVGDGIRIAQQVGADLTLMDQAWWFPAVAPLPGGRPLVMLAERSLPGSFIVDQAGNRFVNEAKDYMSFGQDLLARERAGDPVTDMWIVFDKEYRNSYVFAAGLFPRMPIPDQWYDAGIAAKGRTPGELAAAMGVPQTPFEETFARFNRLAAAGYDSDFRRGSSAYDRYYGDPTVRPNPNLRPLRGNDFFAVRMVPSDLGTCGGIRADEYARALREDGSVIEGLYATGNAAGNVYGHTYPGAGATIGQGLVMAHVAACHAARTIDVRSAAVTVGATT